MTFYLNILINGKKLSVDTFYFNVINNLFSNLLLNSQDEEPGVILLIQIM